jgi:hypothetical protein
MSQFRHINSDSVSVRFDVGNRHPRPGPLEFVGGQQSPNRQQFTRQSRYDGVRTAERCQRLCVVLDRLDKLTVDLERVRLGGIQEIAGIYSQPVEEQLPVFQNEVVPPSRIAGWSWQQRTYFRRTHEIVDALKLCALVLAEKRKPHTGLRRCRFSLCVAAEGVNVVRLLVQPFLNDQTVDLRIFVGSYEKVHAWRALAVDDVEQFGHDGLKDAPRQGAHIHDDVTDASEFSGRLEQSFGGPGRHSAALGREHADIAGRQLCRRHDFSERLHVGFDGFVVRTGRRLVTFLVGEHDHLKGK